ncbi:MAG: TIGR02281 family clan AA aspartic protease [Holosporales bacterium]
MKNKAWIIAVALIAVTGGLVLYLMKAYPDVLTTQDRQVELVRILAILGVLVLWIVSSRIKVGEAIKALMIWAAVGLAVALLYSERQSLQRMGRSLVSHLIPGQGAVNPTGSVAFRKNDDGHFRIEAIVNGERVRFLVDTGASGITLSQEDAERIGIDPNTLSYTIPVQTANGMAFSAPITLDTLAIGPIEHHDVAAKVGSEGLNSSLLGMRFLEGLSSFRIEGDQLILEP